MKFFALSILLGASIAGSMYGAYGQTGSASGGYGTGGTQPNAASSTSGTYSNSGTYGSTNTQSTNPDYQGNYGSSQGNYNSQSHSYSYDNPTGAYNQGAKTGTNNQSTYQTSPSVQPNYMPPQAYNSRPTQGGSYSMNDRQSPAATMDSSAPKANGDAKYATEKKYPKDQYKTESDRAVNNRIREQITGWFSDHFKEIVLRTSEGVVVIDGFVYTPEDQKKLLEEIEQINGVKHVVNNTKIKKQGS